FLTEPPAFLCAIDRPRPYFCVFFGAAALVPADFARATGFFLSPGPLVSALADRVEALGAAFVSVLALVDVLVEPFASAFSAFAAVALSAVALSEASFAAGAAVCSACLRAASSSRWRSVLRASSAFAIAAAALLPSSTM